MKFILSLVLSMNILFAQDIIISFIKKDNKYIKEVEKKFDIKFIKWISCLIHRDGFNLSISKSNL